MKIEKQVVSLEVAHELGTKLKSAGNIENKTLFSWYKERHREAEVCINRDMLSDNICFHELNAHYKGKKGQRIFTPYFSGGCWEWESEFLIPTYTLPEMLDMLPDTFKLSTNKLTYKFMLDKGGVRYSPTGIPETSCDNRVLEFFSIDNKVNPATAAAKLKISLIDNNYIKETPCKNG